MRANPSNNIYAALQQQRMARSTGGSTSNFSTRAEARFARLDSSGDGMLDDSELQRIAQHISQRTGQDVSVEELKARLDGNGDGLVSSTELQNGMPPPPPKRGGLRADFERADTSGDGVLDDDELARVAQQLSQQTGQDVSVADLKTALDTDGSGTVSFDEVKSALPPPPPPGARGGPPGLGQDAFDTSGALSPDVISAMAQQLSSATGTSVNADELHTAMDTNGDGSVDRAEVKNMMMQVRMMRR